MSEPTPDLEPWAIRVPLVRPRVNAVNVNAAALTPTECVAVDRDGAVWFAGPLCETCELAVRDWLSTRDDTDLARRVAYRAVAETSETGRLLNGFAITRAYLLGDPLPAPIYPEPPA